MKYIDIKPVVWSQSLVGFRNQTVPLSYGNYCTIFDSNADKRREFRLGNCWAENIKALAQQYDTLHFRIYDNGDNAVVLLEDHRVPKEYYIPAGGCCLTGSCCNSIDSNGAREGAMEIWNGLPDVTEQAVLVEEEYPEGTSCFKITDNLIGYVTPLNSKPKKLNVKYKTETDEDET